MKINELRSKSAVELTKLAQELRAKLVELGIKNVAGEIKKSHEIKTTRRQLARILTIERQGRITAL